VRGDGPGPLFPNFDRASKGAGRLSGRGLHRIVAAYGARAGVRTWPHGLRHTAVSVGAGTGNLIGAMRFAGHADLKTTGIYLDDQADEGGKVAAAVGAALAAAVAAATREERQSS
jgi:integrase/recombinase XerC